MHPDTRKELGFLLTYLAEHGDEAALKYIKHEYLKGAPIPEDYVEYENLKSFAEANPKIEISFDFPPRNSIIAGAKETE